MAPRNRPSTDGLHLQLQSYFRWGPFQWRGVSHEINGFADYSLWYGPKEEPTLTYALIEAKTGSSMLLGESQLLTYLAMVRGTRRAENRPPEDYTTSQLDRSLFSYLFQISHGPTPCLLKQLAGMSGVWKRALSRSPMINIQYVPWSFATYVTLDFLTN